MRSLTYCGTAALPGVRIYAGASNKLELQRWTGRRERLGEILDAGSK